MLNQIKILVVLLVIISLIVGCSKDSFTVISDCEHIADDIKRDKCLVNSFEHISLNNVDLRIEICNKLSDVEKRDLCLFKSARKSWRYMSPDTLFVLCDNINSTFLKESCHDINFRPHLQVIR